MQKRLFILLLTFFITIPAYASTLFTWTPPTTNQDGSPLGDLAGYKIYCGTVSGNYSITKDINNPTTPEYPINQVVSVDGVYYCAMTAYDTSKNESNFSNEISVPLAVAPVAPGAFGVK